jgi:NAD(P)H-dependent flavin oxidoreductase YrpB (nitropropane dioxygenase family)
VNAFCELVGCRLPLQLAGMSRVASPALAAAVSEAGGLGMIAATRQSPEAAARTLDELAALTTRPVGVSFISLFAERETIDYAATRVPVVELFWGWPEAALVPAGAIAGWQVGSVDEARAAVDAGCRFVVAQGVEAGGHVRGTVPLLELLPAVRAAIDVPLVAAGGIGTAADVRAAMERGADAVRAGTRFVVAEEADTHPLYAEALIAAAPADTVLTATFSVGWPDAPHRVLASADAAARAGGPDPVGVMTLADGRQADLPRRGTTCPTTGTTGQIEAMALYAGTGVGALTRRMPAAAIVAELMAGFGAP